MRVPSNAVPILAAATVAFTALAIADSSPFDLTGPSIDVTVTRAGRTLPIARVPNLRAARRALAASGSASRRGGPLPVHRRIPAWFHQSSAGRLVHSRGDLAEEFGKRAWRSPCPKTHSRCCSFLRPRPSAISAPFAPPCRARPGAFVRASQDLNQASLDRTRLDAYLAAVRATAENDPAEFKKRTTLLARSLGIKLDDQCFDKATEQQAPCLMKGTDQLVLDDSHAESMVAALTTGHGPDLIGELSYTPEAHFGYYSPYVGAFMDVARLLDSLRTAEYQYIPALALPHKDEFDLKLNSPPSFHKPKSVLVTALPAVKAPEFPPVRPVDLKQVACFDKSSALVPAEGAPLVFSTSFGHGLALHIQSASGKTFDLPARADAARGGFVVDMHAFTVPATDVTGTLHGQWGFDSWTGPAFRLHPASSGKWVIPAPEQNALIVGRDDTIHIESPDAVCVDDVTVQDQRGEKIAATWTRTKTDRLELKIPLKDAKPGPLTVLLKQDDTAKPEELHLHSYAEAGHLDRFIVDSGEREGRLLGSHLDDVASVNLRGIRFVPDDAVRDGQKNELVMSAKDGTSALSPGEDPVAQVSLKDGRTLNLPATVGPPEPKVTLISSSVRPDPSASRNSAAIHLGSPNELPQDAKLAFFLKSDVPGVFPRTEKIEVAGPDESFHVLLSVADGSLVLQDSHTVMALLDPRKSFGASAFGPLRFRAVGDEDSHGEWQPLTALVRVPTLTDVRCPASAESQCRLSGTDLFLIGSVSADPQFANAVSVPEGFADSTLAVPRPVGTLLYIELRDDPSVISTAILPVLPE